MITVTLTLTGREFFLLKKYVEFELDKVYHSPAIDDRENLIEVLNDLSDKFNGKEITSKD